MVEINGDWIGYYTFDVGYSDWYKQKKIPFRATIKRGINEFVGQMTEETGFGGVDDFIVIKGLQNGDDIEFTKYYPKEHILDEHNQLQSIESENPTMVYFKGTFHERENRFQGEWEIPGLREDENGIFQAENNTGHWVMWRESK